MNLKPAAPVVSSPVPPPQEFVTKRVAQEGRFATHDGVELFYRYWPSLPARPKGAILLFHRGHEHSGRMVHLVDELEFPDSSPGMRAVTAAPPASGAIARASLPGFATCRTSSTISA
jgi:alpha-beta hydrolase superfamily lysophospholipase